MKINLKLLKNKIRFYWEFRGWRKVKWTAEERYVIGFCHSSNEWAPDPDFFVLKYTCEDLIQFSRAQRAVRALSKDFNTQNIELPAWIDFVEEADDREWVMQQLSICAQYIPLSLDELYELGWVKEIEGMRGAAVRVYSDGDIFVTAYNKWSGDEVNSDVAVSLEELLYNTGLINLNEEE